MSEDHYTVLRNQMVAEALETRGISDPRVLEAMRRVPRHKFVPVNYAADAYENKALPLDLGQTISQPLMVALMLQAAELTGTERVLEVGTGSGYQAALLAELAAHVTTIERLPELADSARSKLQSLGYTGVKIITADGSEGYSPGAPYDRVLVAAGAPRIPESLVRQLAPGAKLILPVGNELEQKLVIVSLDNEGHRTIRDEGWCAFVPLIGNEGWPSLKKTP